MRSFSICTQVLRDRVRLSPSLLLFSRMSSSSSKSLTKFVVYAPDKEGTLDLRYQVRQRHLDGIVPTVKSGVMKLGGMMVDPESDVNLPQKKAIGSLVIYEAESVEQVKRMVETDIYYTSGVWDQEKLVICPFFAATPWP
ncbi:hypothetical protein E1B28_010000 [Marasmius oreades]|uniref:YCII-related domain-containing protein n=1 Tax=Marasmius oreades TaxID=181124 RepID=A0A9P7RW71_9AGAR|nr:uncharacterized protein E1B28_010000 [Marasmius oreades]KAG7090926.1 hypothetical protein E1B28_010000 [Marasmius oreades]